MRDILLFAAVIAGAGVLMAGMADRMSPAPALANAPRKEVTVAVAAMPAAGRSISISPDGRFVYTQDQEAPRIVVIDTGTNAVVRSISLPRIAFSSVVTKDGRWLLANSESGKLFVVDVVSGALTKTFDTPDVPVLPTPGEFALAPDGIHAYVSCPQGGTIEILNLKDWKLEEPIRLTKGVDGMAWVPSTTNSAASGTR